MKTIFFFVFFVSLFILVLGLIEVLLLRVLNKVWWKKKVVRRLALSLPLVGVAGFVVFAAGEFYRIPWLAVPASVVAAMAFILEVCLMLSLPVSGAIHLVDHWVHRLTRHWAPGRGEPPDRRRRLFLKGVAMAVPLGTIGMGVFGVGRSFVSANVYLRRIAMDNLPDDLVGLRILHLSDLHLAHYVTLDDLVTVLQKAQEFQPDVVLVTGDVADDLAQLPGALGLIAESGTPMGCYASLGNHEHFRGLTQVRRTFDGSPVPLLVNEAVRLPVGEASVIIAGIDDPRLMEGGDAGFYTRCLDLALSETRDGDVTVLMSHRPAVFDYAAARGVHLTLAGHTHGAQIGLFGRSLLESYFPRQYLWGHYRTAASHLYTSSGVGHWFPFRLGCPPEAPVLELVRSQGSR
ncbi:MAG TPA: metallophosphoesterase [Acidobacteriota bacterium]|nr:metallophosphoesterase [Acidobacteriota bacterium]